MHLNPSPNSSRRICTNIKGVIIMIIIIIKKEKAITMIDGEETRSSEGDNGVLKIVFQILVG